MLINYRFLVTAACERDFVSLQNSGGVEIVGCNGEGLQRWGDERGIVVQILGA